MHWATKFLCIALSAMLSCEFIADYIKLGQCLWPKVKKENAVTKTNLNVLHAMILADPHLLGPIRGHWLDKFYREWHMRRAFQAAVTLHRPDVVFVLGDLFDEGDLVDQNQFRDYIQQFHYRFATPKGIPVISAVGNHDIGFHYKMLARPLFTKRFGKQFNNTGVNLYSLKDVHFVLINSMAMKNDSCHFCEIALRDLKNIASKLDCLKKSSSCSNSESLFAQLHSYSRPIVLQHFPTYRISDEICKEHDAPIIEKYRENWEVLSKDSTDLIGKLLKPRLAFSGHSHHYCLSINRWGVREYTVASFSWRNKVNPSFLMASLTARSAAVAKCDMLPQHTVYNVYLTTLLLLLLLVLWEIYRISVKNQSLKLQSKNL